MDMQALRALVVEGIEKTTPAKDIYDNSDDVDIVVSCEVEGHLNCLHDILCFIDGSKKSPDDNLVYDPN